MSYQIKVNVAGHGMYPNGESPVLPFSDIDGLHPLVTVQLVSTAGVTSYMWQIFQQPVGASAVLSDPTAAAPTFDLTQDIVGTYLVRCIINGGASVITIGIAATTERMALRIPAPDETTEFGETGWADAMKKLIDYAEAETQRVTDLRGGSAITTANCPAVGGTVVTPITLGFNRGMVLGIRVAAASNTDDSTIEFYRDVAMTDQIYEKLAVDCFASAWVDRNPWCISTTGGDLVGGIIYSKITNNDAADDSVYEIEIMAMGVN